MPTAHDDQSPHCHTQPDPLAPSAPPNLRPPVVPASPDPSLSGASTQVDNADPSLSGASTQVDNADPSVSGASTQVDVVAARHSGANSFAGPSPAGPSPAGPSVPIPEHAFTLYTQGHRTSAIAARLGVSPRTIRRWLRKILKDLVLTSRDERLAELIRAIESQRAVVSAAWESYARESRRDEQRLSGQLDPLAHHNNVGARYLAVISAAQREIARLENLYDATLLSEASHITITITRRPEGPENIPPHERPLRFPHLYPPSTSDSALASGGDNALDDNGKVDDVEDLDESGQYQEHPA